MNTIQFFAPGNPKGQPRPRAFARKFGAKYSARMYDPDTADAWKAEFALVAKKHVPETPILGAVGLVARFYFARPASHYGSGRNATVLKSSAPTPHVGKPDWDNLVKLVADQMTQLGFWKDDSQINSGWAEKFWCDYAKDSGCSIQLRYHL